uniref:Uncharacterized protein n=1 Tax=Arion vulgaris TaxID=1028688 RepID=A0A0B7BKG9_9EUPU
MLSDRLFGEVTQIGDSSILRLKEFEIKRCTRTGHLFILNDLVGLECRRSKMSSNSICEHCRSSASGKHQPDGEQFADI